MGNKATVINIKYNFYLKKIYLPKVLLSWIFAYYFCCWKPLRAWDCTGVGSFFIKYLAHIYMSPTHEKCRKNIPGTYIVYYTIVILLTEYRYFHALHQVWEFETGRIRMQSFLFLGKTVQSNLGHDRVCNTDPKLPCKTC